LSNEREQSSVPSVDVAPVSVPIAPLIPPWLLWPLAGSIPLVWAAMGLAVDSVRYAATFVAAAIPLLLAGRSAASSASRWAAAARLAGGGALGVAFSRAVAHWWLSWAPSWQLELQIVERLGGLAAVWCAVFALLTHRSRRVWSSDVADRAAAIALLWVAAPDAVFQAVVRGRPDFPEAFLNVGLALGVVAPVALAVLALFRMVDRRRWLGLVADGKMPGWALVETPDAPPNTLPLVSGSDGTRMSLLVRTEVSEYPFRASGGTAVARVGASRKESAAT
jgi:hypothetical protein